MKLLHRQLLRRIPAVPAGERLPVAAFARDLNCSQSVIVDALSAMVADGLLDRATLRAPPGSEYPLC